MIWQNPASFPVLNDQSVHLWQVNLQVADNVVQKLAHTLSEDEMAKADRFHFAQHRRRYILARGRLRQVLGQYLNISPDQIRFNYSPKGKPSLDLPQISPKLEFNLSHSEEIALFVITLMRQVGVDLEKIRPMKDVEAIAQRYFCREEGALIQALKDEEQIKTFFQLWTAKEAYLKAIGVGIGGGLDRVLIQWKNGKIEGLLPHDGLDQSKRSWGLVSFPLADDYVGAMVIEDTGWQLQCFSADAL